MTYDLSARVYLRFSFTYSQKNAPAQAEKQRVDLLFSVGEKAVTPISKLLYQKETPQLAKPHKEMQSLHTLITLQKIIKIKASSQKLL